MPCLAAGVASQFCSDIFSKKAPQLNTNHYLTKVAEGRGTFTDKPLTPTRSFRYSAVEISTLVPKK